MSPSIKQKKAIPVFLVALVLACFTISRSVQAAQPTGIQDVNVFNTPFQRQIHVVVYPGQFGTFEPVFNIPAGKTLVVEFVSVQVRVPAGQQPVLLFETGDGNGVASLFLNLQLSDINRDIFVASQQIRLYTKNQLFIGVDRDVNTSYAIITGSVIGYLVNTP
jgi:hypothetical protein